MSEVQPLTSGAGLLHELQALTQWHLQACTPYRAVVETMFPDFAGTSAGWGAARSNAATGAPAQAQTQVQTQVQTQTQTQTQALAALPFLPVRLFKTTRLLSVPEEDIIKTLTSSGTSGQAVSQVFLDKPTAQAQTRALAQIVSSLLGPSRLPMLVIDTASTVANRARFSARAAGIRGFSMFGREVVFALDDDMSLNFPRVQAFAEKYASQPKLLFGFTYMVWQHLVRALEDSGRVLPLAQGVLIHGGGWKQLSEQAVGAGVFASRMAGTCGVTQVHNYYGMAEQTGSIFMGCEHGHLHLSPWSEVLIRDPLTFEPLPNGQPGLIEVFSTLPKSYPGHALLTEDMGTLVADDGCSCGRPGKHFVVHGRLAKSEARGCSDTYRA